MIEIKLVLTLAERGGPDEPCDMTVSSAMQGALFGREASPLGADLQQFLARMAAMWMKQTFGDSIEMKDVEPEGGRIITVN